MSRACCGAALDSRFGVKVRGIIPSAVLPACENEYELSSHRTPTGRPSPRGRQEGDIGRSRQSKDFPCRTIRFSYPSGQSAIEPLKSSIGDLPLDLLSQLPCVM
ncbi:unnamed protein product [Ectocarpus sp. 12 AP-2014]